MHEIPRMPGMYNLFGFGLEDFGSWSSYVRLINSPRIGTSLAAIRILFGCLMIMDTVEERGMAVAELRWGNPSECRFPLFQFIKPLPLNGMYAVYLTMIIGAIGITLGLFYRLSCLIYALSFWYIVLLDKTSWNNHSYLFGLTSILLLVSDANQCCSLDRWRGVTDPSKSFIPLWNYALFRAQIFIVFFIAGLKKLNADWLLGYSMHSLAEHWIFDPFKFVLTVDQIDLYIVHLGGFLIDISMGFLLFFDATRLLGLTIGTTFHGMNSMIFHIGMFPYAMIVFSLVFCDCDWPTYCIEKLKKLWLSQNYTAAGSSVASQRVSDSHRDDASNEVDDASKGESVQHEETDISNNEESERNKKQEHTEEHPLPSHLVEQEEKLKIIEKPKQKRDKIPKNIWVEGPEKKKNLRKKGGEEQRLPYNPSQASQIEEKNETEESEKYVSGKGNECEVETKKGESLREIKESEAEGERTVSGVTKKDILKEAEQSAKQEVEPDNIKSSKSLIDHTEEHNQQQINQRQTENQICAPVVKQEIDCSSDFILKEHVAAFGFIIHILLQLFLPYSQFLTPGFNGWNTGLYGYSWDMMINSWNLQHIRIQFNDPETGNSGFINPDVWGANKHRWSHEASMIKQYAVCIRDRLITEYNTSLSTQIYLDIWISLNDRFQQRMVRPNVDIAGADWSPFRNPAWLLPLLSELSDWRIRLSELETQLALDTWNESDEKRSDLTGERKNRLMAASDKIGALLEDSTSIYTDSDSRNAIPDERSSATVADKEDSNTGSDINSASRSSRSNERISNSDINRRRNKNGNYSVVFMADYPEMTIENFIQPDLDDVWMEVLKGSAVVELPESEFKPSLAKRTLNSGDRIQLPKEVLHMIHTVSEAPSCFMITFKNTTQQLQESEARLYTELKNLVNLYGNLSVAVSIAEIEDDLEIERIWQEGEARRLRHEAELMTSSIIHFMTERYFVYKMTLSKAISAMKKLLTELALVLLGISD